MGKGTKAAEAPSEEAVPVEIAQTPEEWQAILKRPTEIYKPTVVAFVAAWCTKCREIAPRFAQSSNRFPGMYFASVNIDALPDVAAQWDVERVPTFVFMRSGRQIDVVVGADMDEVNRKAESYTLPMQPQA